MKFTLSWLKTFLDTNASLDEITAVLTANGLEVEAVEDKSALLKPFTVAEIVEANPHPDADRLRVCRVNSFSGERTIVCGAPNARAGIKVVLADIGNIIPNGNFAIKLSKIRGVESQGMLCSKSELLLDGDSEGIIELPLDAKIGASIVEVLGLGDPVIEIAVTPNRADCLGIYGIARDLAAAGLGTLKPLDKTPVNTNKKTPTNINIKTDACLQFAGRLISGVKNCESPDWLKRQLEAIGLRPISALVDITNYFTFSYARPLHAYDFAKINGDLVVRTAKNGDEFEALNAKKYELTDICCVIADDSGVLALGGIIGGQGSACSLETNEIFLEAAIFAAPAIAQAGRALKIESDARYRFERHVDADSIIWGLEAATRMILEICGGEAAEIIIAGAAEQGAEPIKFNAEWVKKLSGMEIAPEKCSAILQSLGFSVQGEQVTPPSWRADVTQPADLVEEILRIYGYDNIIEVPLPAGDAKSVENKLEANIRTSKRLLANRSMNECVHFAFIEQKQANLFKREADVLVQVINPISSEMDTMRPCLIAGFLSAANRNIARGNANLALFEVGTCFYGISPAQQTLQAAGIRTGKSALHWSATPKEVDVFAVKADIFAVLEALGVNVARVRISSDAASWYHPGKSGRVSLGGKVTLGYFGEIHPKILREFGVEQAVVAFEILLENIPVARNKPEIEILKTSDFQITRRDFALVVDAKLPATDIIDAVISAEKQLIKDVSLFDVYQGKNLPEDKKSLGIAVFLQAEDRTLGEEDINKTTSAILANVAKLGAQLR